MIAWVPGILALGGGLAGACVGSFAATAVLRMARAEPFIAGRSRCDHCLAPLSYTRTVPVLSYVLARGRCSACLGPIASIHLFGEIAGAGLGASLAVAATPWTLAPLAALAIALLALTLVDLRTRRIPDLLTLVVAAACLSLAAMGGVATMLVGLGCAAAAIGVLCLVRWVFRQTRGDPGLGLGDVKLIGALALWLGVSTPWAIVGASCLGLGVILVKKPSDGRISFGPAIAASAWAVGLIHGFLIRTPGH